MSQYTLPVQTNLVEALAPAADAAGRSGAWVSCKDASQVYVIVNITNGHATAVPLTFQQATSVAGANAKALTGNMRIWANADVAASDTLVAQTAAKTFSTAAAVKNVLVVFEVDPAAVLDINNGFGYLQVITGASNAANITSAVYLRTGIGYQQATPPSAVV